MAEQLDAVDAKILDLIQHDASLSVAEIAERVGLSSSPCWRRIKRLEDAGIIQRRVTILDREQLGLGFEVYCTVKLSLPTKENLELFESNVVKWAEVVQCAT
ncbi:MAG: Lrp/AsnC family transcriptional regulator, partial [Caulobacter sp.]|nr:Lrp/AsnC family transcriptional regulator [Caulobacter sp.]